MPKIIKKKVKKEAKGEDEFQSIVQRTKNLKENVQDFKIIIIAILVVAVLVPVWFLYQGSQRKAAEKLFYEGYTLYYNEGGALAIPDVTRYEEALATFESSWNKKASPTTLYYVALCQFDLGRFDDFRAAVETFKSKYPDNAELNVLLDYKLAIVSMREGNSAQALAQLESIENGAYIGLKDLALVEAARILEEQGDHEESQFKYGLVVKNMPYSPFSDDALRYYEQDLTPAVPEGPSGDTAPPTFESPTGTQTETVPYTLEPMPLEDKTE